MQLALEPFAKFENVRDLTFDLVTSQSPAVHLERRISHIQALLREIGELLRRRKTAVLVAMQR